MNPPVVPEALQPGKHRVHHSYIWLGGLHGAFVALVAVGCSVLGSVAPDVQGIPAEAIPWIIGISVLAGLLIVGLIFLTQWLSWKFMSYELTEAEFNLYSGIISKKRLHVPYQRIQSVNQSAGILQRILGLCNVQMDTAGGADNESVTLKYLRNSDAEALRAELFRRKKVLLAGGSIDKNGNVFVSGTVIPSAWTLACHGGDAYAAFVSLGVAPDQAYAAATSTYDSASVAFQESERSANVLDAADEILQDVRGVFGGAEVITGEVSYEQGLSNKELLFAGMSGAAGHLGVVIASVLGVAGLVAPTLGGLLEEWIEQSLEMALTGADAAAIASGTNAVVWWAAGFIILAIVIVWLLSVVGTMLRFGGFKVRRRESRVEVEQGLLKRTFHGVDVDRVQSVFIRQNLVRRLIGYCELSVGKIDSHSEGDQDISLDARVVIHPFVKKGRVPEILASVLPEFSDVPQETIKPAPVALRRAIIRTVAIRSVAFWFFLVALACQIGLKMGMDSGFLPLDMGTYSVLQTLLLVYDAIFAVTAVIHLIDAVLWHRASAMGYNRAFMRITNGGLSQETVMLPRKKIQFAFTRSNPFQRLAKVETVYAVTAAGIGGTAESLWDLSVADADAWMEWARPRGSVRN